MAEAEWLAAPLNTNLDLTGLALTMAKPEFDLMPKELGAVEITTEGDITVRTYHLNSKALGLPTSGDVTLVFRTASEGQVIGLTVTIKAANQDMTIALTMDSYNGPVAIAVPKASSVKPLTSDSLQQIVAGNDTLKQLLGGLMSGGNLSELGRNTLNLEAREAHLTVGRTPRAVLRVSMLDWFSPGVLRRDRNASPGPVRC
jgi:hypothetical protein